MKRQIFANVAALVLAAGMTTGAMAFDEGAGIGTHHARGVQSVRARHDSRFAGVRGYESWRHGGWGYRGSAHEGGFIDLGPLGFTAGCGRSTCSPGYSVSAWSW